MAGLQGHASKSNHQGVLTKRRDSCPIPRTGMLIAV